MNPVKIAIKLVIMTIISICTGIFHSAVSPIVANELAMLQMSNSTDSSMWIQIYSQLMNYTWIIPVIIALIMFIPELSYLIKKLTNKGDNNNEAQ